MSESTSRIRFSSTIDKNLAVGLKKLSDKTMIPQSKLIDKAIEKLIKYYSEKGQG